MSYRTDRKWSREEIQKYLDYPRWAKVRKQMLRIQPNCVKCLRRGFIVEATDVDHIIPKRDTEMEMWYDFSNLQCLCKHCHDVSKREEENKGYCEDIGADGFPIDSRHPMNKRSNNVLSIDEFKKEMKKNA